MSGKSCYAFSLIVAILLTSQAISQSLTSGDLTGLVTDPSGAVISGAHVAITNKATGSTQNQTTNNQGVYRFSLLSPGLYSISISAPNLKEERQSVGVAVGQVATLNVQLQLASSTQTVEVTGEGGVIQAEIADLSTTFSPEQITEVPNPGNDLSYIVQTAPGATMNTQGGYGNTAIYGLPATSNLFTVDGMSENDPFLNLNNSGATNLLLGQNDIEQATVVNNGYSGQYGGLAGANVNYVTKSGSNQWHGNAIYWWNGRTMNANNFFNNRTGTPRPFDNANQWAASLGGPIHKDTSFFFVNTEGLRVLLPTSTKVNIPSPQYEAAALANLASQPAVAGSIPFYTQLFSLWNNAPGANRAQDVLPSGTASNGQTTGHGCGTFLGLGSSIPCALQFQSTVGNQTNEWLLTARVDQKFGTNDRAFVHFRTDHGLQATYTDPISAAFNGQSNQPQYEGQLQETHTFGSTAVNQFIASGSWYSAIFTTRSLAASTQLIPFRLGFSGNAFYSLGRDLNTWPQGRNVSQYGIVDDYSKIIGNHSIKVGINFRRNDVTDYSPGIGSIGYSQGDDLSNFYNGLGVSYVQNFAKRLTEPIAIYGLGFYGQDEWSIRPHFKVTLTLRGDHDSNPVCQTDCFARFSTDFLNVAHENNIPYNQVIRTGLHQVFSKYTSVSWQPRVGFTWSPLNGSTGTVLRGGFGLFTDMFPATIADYLLNNAPLNNQFVAGAGPISPAVFGNQASLAAGANSSFLHGFYAGESLTQIQQQNALFVPPSFYNAAERIIAPQYEEWNLQLEQAFGTKTSLAVNYVGNHGVHEASQNPGLNAYNPTAFGDLPLAPLDARFGTITEVSTPAVSNYSGLSVTFRRQFSSIQFQANYTWSHALDDVSNAGFLQYDLLTNTSVLAPQDPSNLKRYNYGNADYDVRHYFSLNYLWTVPRWKGPEVLADGWVFSGTIFARSGLPFTVVDGNQTAVLSALNYGGALNGSGAFVYANYRGGAPSSCDSSAVNSPCLTTAMFSPTTNNFGIQRRNQFYGPKYFDTDFTVMKNFKIPGWEHAKFGIGAQFFNFFNHPNFDQPVGDISNPNFGSIIGTVNTPTSILGSFLGGDASPRLIQFKGTLTF